MNTPSPATENEDDEESGGWWDAFKAALPLILGVILVVGIAYKFVDPAPPKKIVINTSRNDGNYSAFARLYAELLRKDGITLELRESDGAIDSLHNLRDDASGIDLAFLQGGVASAESNAGLVSLGSLYYEPIWIFAHGKARIAHLSSLKGKRIAVGRDDSGTRVLALLILRAAGVDEKNSHLVSIGDQAAADAVRQGRVDVAFLLGTPTNPLIQEMVADARVTLASLDEAEAYARQYNFLHHLVLPEGGLNLATNNPHHEVHLLATTVTLVAKDSIHPALVYLVLKVISQVHGGAGIFQREHEFPSDKDTDFELSSQAEHFYKSGLPFLDRYLPFWAATFVNRLLIVLVPLLAIAIPLSRIAPSIYVWLVKSRIYKLYGELRFLEAQLRDRVDDGTRQHCLDELNVIEHKVNHLRLPVAFTHHLYELRMHIELVRSKLAAQKN